VALGACIIEKHLTLSRADGGPDAAFSLEPQEFKEMVNAAATAFVALGTVDYTPTSRERESLAFRRSIYVAKDIRAGEALTPENVRVIRPAGGLHPRYYENVLGRIAVHDLQAGTPLAWEQLASRSA